MKNIVLVKSSFGFFSKMLQKSPNELFLANPTELCCYCSNQRINVNFVMGKFENFLKSKLSLKLHRALFKKQIFFFFFKFKNLQVKVKVLARSTLCDFIDCSPPGSSVHGILQARILEWVAIPSYRGSSQPRDRTLVSYSAGRFFTI